MRDNLKIITASWNLATIVPHQRDWELLDIASLFRSSDGSSGGAPADIICVGLQELVSQTAALQLPPSETHFNGFSDTDKNRSSNSVLLEWAYRLQSAAETLYSKSFALVVAKRATAIALIVLASSDFISHHKISSCRDGNLPVGLGGVYGNKGGIAFSFDVSSTSSKNDTSTPVTSLCFVNVHLQAHEGESYFQARNDDLSQIMDCLVLESSSRHHKQQQQYSSLAAIISSPVFSYIIPSDDKDVSINNNNSDTWRSIKENDVVWIVGDFNYRLRVRGNKSAARKSILADISSSRFDVCLSMDELRILLLKSSPSISPFALAEFQEQDITFPPTYKFKLSKKSKGGEKGGVEYSKKRMPAYCDRIVFWSRGGRNDIVKPHVYTNVTILQGWSDHLPVSAAFSVDVSKGGSSGNSGSNLSSRRQEIWVKRRKRFIDKTIVPLLVTTSFLLVTYILVSQIIFLK